MVVMMVRAVMVMVVEMMVMAVMVMEVEMMIKKGR
jgi:hypothetical protein